MNRVLDDSTRLDSTRVESSRVGPSENTCRVESSRVRVESSRVEPSRLFFDSFRPLIETTHFMKPFLSSHLNPRGNLI
jgi:hypothetical protein